MNTGCVKPFPCAHRNLLAHRCVIIPIFCLWFSLRSEAPSWREPCWRADVRGSLFSQFRKHFRKKSDPRGRKEIAPFCLGTRLMATRPVVVWLWLIPAHIVRINFIVYGTKHQAGLETWGTSKRASDQHKPPSTKLAIHWGWQDNFLVCQEVV